MSSDIGVYLFGARDNQKTEINTPPKPTSPTSSASSTKKAEKTKPSAPVDSSNIFFDALMNSQNVLPSTIPTQYMQFVPAKLAEVAKKTNFFRPSPEAVSNDFLLGNR